jgi:hypothetical protein
MNTENTIKAELEALESGLVNYPQSLPYSVPEGYFNALAGNILGRIKARDVQAADELAELSPLLSGLSRNMPFAVPAEYFESNMDDLAGIVKEDESSVILSLIEKEMPNEVPYGYFDGLSESILTRVAPRKAKVVSLSGRNWTRFAVAALMAGIITVSGIFYLNRSKDVPVDNPQWVASKLKTVSDKELEEFVKSTDPHQTAVVTAKKTTAKTTQSKRLLQDISDKDLDAFLDQVPSDDEALAIN